MLRKLIWLFLGILFFAEIPVPAGATVLDQIKTDFQPASGYIIMPAGDEFLIDQDASTGAGTGDLYAVVQPGEKIIHPVTKEVLGTLDTVKGLLQITRVKTGYSYAIPVGKAEGLVRGEVVRRFDHVPTAFWDYTGQGELFFNQLKAALPALDWQPYPVAQAERPAAPTAENAGSAPLVFVLRGDGLTVHGPNFVEMKTYPLPEGIVASRASEPQASASSSAPSPSPIVPVPAPVPVAEKGKTAPKTQETRSFEEAKVLPTYPGFQIIEHFPEGIFWADFVQTPDGMMLAATDGSKIQVYSLRNNQLTMVASGGPKYPGKILTLAWWQPADGAPLHLAATMAVDVNRPYSSAEEKTINGAIFALQGSSLVSITESLTYLLGTFDLDNNGSRETLLGQSFDEENVFGSEIRRLALKEGQIEFLPFGMSLPWQFPVTGGRFIDVTGDGMKEAVFVRNRVLFVYRGQEKIYESTRTMGGSVSAMNYSAFAARKGELYKSVAFEIPPLAADVDGDGQKEIIAVGSKGTSFTSGRIGPGIDSAGLVVLKYRGGAFQKGSLGDQQELPIQGVAIGQEGYYLVVTQPQGLTGVVGPSQLLLLPYTQP